jgi:hypothetical protein
MSDPDTPGREWRPLQCHGLCLEVSWQKSTQRVLVRSLQFPDLILASYTADDWTSRTDRLKLTRRIDPIDWFGEIGDLLDEDELYMFLFDVVQGNFDLPRLQHPSP